MGLYEKIDVIKRKLTEDEASYMFAVFPSGVALAEGVPAGAPEELRRLLASTNGPRTSDMAVFAAEDLSKFQFYCDDVDILEGGRSRWLCFALIEDFPVMIERVTGSVWWFPEIGLEYYFMGERFEPLADNVEAFFDHYVLGPGYRKLFEGGLGYRELFEGGHIPWYEFLRRENFVR
jgi:hypothetical protein